MKVPAFVAIAVAATASMGAEGATCPLDTTVGSLGAGFTCTLADKTFSNFVFADVPAATQIQFGQLGPLFTVTLSRDGVFFPVGTTVFDYTITAAAPATIKLGTVGIDVSFPTVVSVATMNGMALSPASILNSGSANIDFGPVGFGTVVVDNTSHITSGVSQLNSITDDFAQVEVVSVPETGTLPLAALGFAGLMFVWKRRRDDA